MNVLAKMIFSALLLAVPCGAFAETVAAGLTDRGVVRDHNEDSYAILADQQVYVLADGMGGHAAGEVASEMAVSVIRMMVSLPAFEAAGNVWPPMRTNVVTAAYHLANALILRDSAATPEHRGMGTTAVSAVRRGDRMDIVNVGDSRAYVIRGGAIRQVSRDQSLLQHLIDEGRLKTQEEIDAFPHKNIIMQAMGTQPDIVPDVFVEKIEPGDLFLLCSDGLTDELSDGQILDIVQNSDGNLTETSKTLVNRANEAGGRDNITVVLIRP